MKHFKHVYFNMNNSVTVLLTEKGVSFLEDHHKERREWFLTQTRTKRDIGEFKRPENNLYKTQMWNLIGMFGQMNGWELDQHFSMEVTLGSVSIAEEKVQQTIETMQKQLTDQNERMREALEYISRQDLGGVHTYAFQVLEQIDKGAK